MNSAKRVTISDTHHSASFSEEFNYYIEFFANLSELITYNGRIISLITDKNIHHLDTGLITSAVQTLKSIKLCCSIGSFADANTLVRKLRDDLIQYVYVLDVINHRKPFIEEDLHTVIIEDPEKFASSLLNLRFNNALTEDEQLVDAWFNNTVDELPSKIKRNLSFRHYMRRLVQTENIGEIITSYKLQAYWEKLQTKLNNYVPQ